MLIYLFEIDCYNHVRSTGGFVHVSSSCCSVNSTLVHKSLYFTVALNRGSLKDYIVMKMNS